MDNGDGGTPPGSVGQNDEQASDLNISDVFEAISIADPWFGAGASVDATMPRQPAVSGAAPFMRITEQPASKSLRFRYECEGRSAGSIPGVNSTPENRTYPTLKVFNYVGRAVIVVSCVTKDEPYRPHPHNLVGRERCDKGVCTIKTEITEDGFEYQFKNLGIQCIRRRDVPAALRVREDLRVDPYRTGYSHRNQPQSIDLNAVRLCFQVFLQNESGKVWQSLPPVVSDVIFDKKAMSDLLITRASHCSGTTRGGTQLILLCEKVTREDTAVVFYQEENNQVVWEETAIIAHVHKQVAIVFQTPPYRNPHTTEHVNVMFQLKRLTDNIRSNSLPYEYIPDFQGTARKPLPDLSLLTLLLNDRRTDDNNNKHDKRDVTVTSTSDPIVIDEPEIIEVVESEVPDVNGNVADSEPEIVDSNEKSLDDLLDQVAELDEIYSENRTRLENVTSLSNDTETDMEDFNDAGTYTSLQLAFKNPVTIIEPETLPYEDVQVQTYRGPIIEFSPLKRDTDDERAPPLPPKRVRKTTSNDAFKTSQTSVDSILKPGRQLPVTRNTDILKQDKPLTVAKSEPALPPVKKRSFFSRLFRRKDKSPAPSVNSEGKKESKSKPVGRSVSSVSGLRPSKFKSSVSHTSLKDNASGTGLSYADSITHISLHGDGDDKSTSQSSLRRPASLAPLPPLDGGTILVAESVLALDATAFKKLQDDLDLTEAEHYALYMAVAPHATVSEFDETSCYYSPVDGNSDYLRGKRRKTLIPSMLHTTFEQDRSFQVDPMSIKAEPKDKTPPHQNIASPPLHVYPPHYAEQDWGMHMEMQPGLVPPGPNQLNPFVQNMPWQGTSYGQPISPNLQTLSPNVQALSPIGQALSPNVQALSPAHAQAMSPIHAQALSPNAQVLSPMGQAMSPMGQARSPMDQAMSPMHGGVSPNHMGHISPNLVQQANYAQMPQQVTMETSQSYNPSLSTLLMERGEGQNITFNSTELSGLSSLLGNNNPDLSDSLNRLSTSELQNYLN